MSLHSAQWIVAPAEPARVEHLCRELGILPAVAQVLINRGLKEVEEARQFLHPDFDQILPPAEMEGMDRAVSRICLALDRGEKIVIYGDYDADGVTAAALLVETLAGLGGAVDFFLPDRIQGYGVHREALQQLQEEGASLVVTVDCGITAREEARYCRQSGLDLIITDHHQPREPLPGAVAVLNPLRKDCPYRFKWLSGVGVAFKLAAALLEKAGKEFPHHLLDLVALGTVADMVPLLGENRALVSLGLAEMNRSLRPGLQALTKEADLATEKIGARFLAFGLGPVLNAAGRMGDADPAVHLLLEQEPERARELACFLYRQNQCRREMESKIFAEAEALVAADPRAAGEKVITLAREGWHPGVIGIVASRLVEQFYRPVVIIAVEEGIGRGSARSIPGFNLIGALGECAALLEQFGGHEQAAGLTIVPGRVGELRAELNRVAGLRLRPEDLVPRRHVEAELAAAEINLELAAQLARLEPFGVANPVPVFGSRSWELRSWRLVGADKNHLKLDFMRENRPLKPILFSGGALASRLRRYRKLDLAFNLQVGTFRKQSILNVELKDLTYGDVAASGRLELIDRRGEAGRAGYIRELTRTGGPVTVFVSTRRREEMLKRRLPPEAVTFISSGKKHRQALLERGRPLVLYDLPLHFRLLAPYFKEQEALSKIQVHLLYNSRGREINEKLMALALPSAEALQQIYRALQESAAGAGKGLVFPGPLAGRFSSSPRYWQRCRDILLESGVLTAGPGQQVAVTPGREGGSEELELSATYRSTRQLVRECREFQERLLLESGPKLADYMNSLIEKYS